MNKSSTNFTKMIMDKKFALSALAAVAIIALQGCAVQTIKNKVDANIESKVDSGNEARERLMDDIRASVSRRDSDSEVNHPYIAGKATPLPRSIVLPAVLQKNVPVEVLFPKSESIDLVDAAALISMATQVAIRVGPDALLPAESFLPRSGTVAGGSSASPGQASTKSGKINMRVKEMPLMSLLDYVASQTGTYWKWDGNAVQIYRLETRTFRLKTLSQKVSTSSGLGRNSGQNQLFESSGTTRLESKDLDPIAAAQKTIEALMSRAGTLAISNETGSVVVTDTKDALDRIDKHIANENKSMTRRVKLIFESIEVQLNDSGETGIDWNLLYSKATPTNGVSTGAMTPLGSTVGSNATGITLNLFGNSKFAGTSVILKALAEQGRIFNKSTIPMSTLNRRPISHAVRTTFNYVDQIQNNNTTATNGTTNQAAPSITQKEETVGTLITIVPDASEDGTLLMSIAFDSTVLTSLTPFTAGNGSNAMTVQQKTIDGTGTLQQIVMRSGQTAVISGFEKTSDHYKERRLDKYSPLLLGGSDVAASQRTTKVLLVTAVVEEGV
jgi:type IVB pilus formation R64 PilN family outer membrane protein